MKETTAIAILKLACLLTIGFGLVFAVVPIDRLSLPATLFTDFVVWPPFDNGQSLSAPETRLYATVLGGVMVGWGTMHWMVVTNLIGVQNGLAVRMIRTSTLAWFVVDSTGSALTGAGVNILSNLVFLALFVLPLTVLSRRG